MDQLTLLPEDSLANLTASPGNAEATMMTVRSGRKCSESYERQGPLGSLVRMCLESSVWHSTACLLIWSVKATPARRSLFQLAPWMQSTDETESGLWPTAVANDDNKTPEAHMRMKQRMKGGARSTITSLQVMVKAVDRKLWPSPTASVGGPEPEGKTGRKLATMVKLYPTPDVGMAKGRGIASTEDRSRLGGSLNPTWVEWLMGYPLGWTDLKDSGTPSSLKSPPRSYRKSSKSTSAP